MHDDAGIVKSPRSYFEPYCGNMFDYNGLIFYCWFPKGHKGPHQASGVDPGGRKWQLQWGDYNQEKSAK